MKLLALFIFGVLGCWYHPNHSDLSTRPKPFIYNINRLNDIKGKGVEDPINKKFLRDVDKIISKDPLTVVGKAHSFSTNPHDYCSIAPYGWLDENDPSGSYSTIDGVVNPERNDYDRLKLKELADRLQQFSVAYYISENEVYYNSFVNNLTTWFVDTLTYMTPNFEYAQVLRGKDDNKGRPYGLVEMEDFTRIIESIYLINNVRLLDEEIVSSLQLWFTSFLNWVVNSRQWEIQSKSNNNIVTGCNVALLEMSLFTGNKKNAKQIVENNKNSILKQIDDEGKQSAELRRTKAFGYSVYNLRKIIDFALITDQLGYKFYKNNQRKIDAAFEYLLQFVGNYDTFPYQQINDFDIYEKQLKKNMARLTRLKSRKSKIIEEAMRIPSTMTKNIVSYVY